MNAFFEFVATDKRGDAFNVSHTFKSIETAVTYFNAARNDENKLDIGIKHVADDGWSGVLGYSWIGIDGTRKSCVSWAE
jgi:hypothetical protein